MKDMKKLVKMAHDIESSFRAMDKFIDSMGLEDEDNVDSMTDEEVEMVFDLMRRFIKRVNKALKFAEKKGLKKEVFKLAEDMANNH